MPSSLFANLFETAPGVAAQGLQGAMAGQQIRTEREMREAEARERRERAIREEMWRQAAEERQKRMLELQEKREDRLSQPSPPTVSREGIGPGGVRTRVSGAPDQVDDFELEPEPSNPNQFVVAGRRFDSLEEAAEARRKLGIGGEDGNTLSPTSVLNRRAQMVTGAGDSISRLRTSNLWLRARNDPEAQQRLLDEAVQAYGYENYDEYRSDARALMTTLRGRPRPPEGGGGEQPADGGVSEPGAGGQPSATDVALQLRNQHPDWTEDQIIEELRRRGLIADGGDGS